MTKEQLIDRIRAKSISLGGANKAARVYGVSATHLSDVVGLKRDPGPKLLRGMKLRKVVEYKPVEEAKA